MGGRRSRFRENQFYSTISFRQSDCMTMLSAQFGAQAIENIGSLTELTPRRTRARAKRGYIETAHAGAFPHSLLSGGGAWELRVRSVGLDPRRLQSCLCVD